MFKHIITWALAAVLLSLPQAKALQIKDLVGDWKGKHTETIRGSGTTFQIILKGSRKRNGTVRLVEKATAASIVSSYVFKQNGSFSFRSVQSGMFVRSSYHGTWKVQHGKVLVSGNGTLGKLRGSISETKSGFKFSGNASSTRVVITAKKK